VHVLSVHRTAMRGLVLHALAISLLLTAAVCAVRVCEQRCAVTYRLETGREAQR